MSMYLPLLLLILIVALTGSEYSLIPEFMFSTSGVPPLLVTVTVTVPPATAFMFTVMVRVPGPVPTLMEQVPWALMTPARISNVTTKRWIVAIR